MSCHHENLSACESKGVCPVKVYMANLAVWNAKLHNLHWNVVGRAFVQVHEFTESLYDAAFEQYDQVAEAIKMRDGFPPVKLAEFLELATIEELESRDYPVGEVVEVVLADMLKMQALAKEIRKGADEMGDDLLVAQFDGYLESYAKNVWFLKAMTKNA
ncbi:MAG: DNA starvation/stationary phase protection protein [Sutterellaceae bacterium]|nr:DNA starvation/stationary phase protection protein [Sutterellaceae bacterium]